MPRVAPFEALVYDVAVSGPLDLVSAPPYDVISEDRRGAYLSESPCNIVHLDLAEGSRDAGAVDSRYTHAAALLSEWRSRGVLVRTPSSYFAYELRFQLDGIARRVRGLFCAMELEPWGGDVLPHEETMPGPIADRLQLLRSTRTHLSPIYGTIAGPCPSLSQLLDRATASPAPFALVDEEGVGHRMWPVSGEEPVGEWLAGTQLLIADGHHRYTTALAYRDERNAADGPGPWDRILTLLVDAGSEDVPVLPYHRVQAAGEPPSGGEPVGDLASLLRALDDTRVRYGTVTRAADGAAEYRLHTLSGEPPAVRALHEEVLDRVAPDDVIRFTHDAGAADRAVRSGEAVAAYLLPPTTPDRIAKVIGRGERLPRKSTFYWPKPRTGLVLMPLDTEERELSR